MQDSHMILDDFTPQFSTPLPSNMLVQLLIFRSSQPFTFPDHMLTHLRLDNRRGWVRGWAKLCTCFIG